MTGVQTCALPICSSAGKESGFNPGDPGLIPGLGRSPGEGIVYLLQYSWASLLAQTSVDPARIISDISECCWASLVAQLVKNWPAMWETWVKSLGWADTLEKGNKISSILA